MPAFALLCVLLVFLALCIGAVCGYIALAQVRACERRLTALQRAVAVQGAALGEGSPVPPSAAAVSASQHAAPVTDQQTVQPALDSVSAPPPVSAAAPPAAPAAPAAICPILPAPAVSVAVAPAVPACASAPERAPAHPEEEGLLFPRRRHATGGLDWEGLIGGRLLTWVGIGIVFLAAAFFLRFAYVQGWLGQLLTPPVRLGMIGAGAVCALLLGQVLHARTRILGQALIGGAVALVGLTIFAAYQPALLVVPEPYLSPGASFVLLALTCLGGLGLALRYDAQAVALLCLLGGHATPLLLSSGGGSAHLLFAWLAVVDGMVLLAALWRSWRWLDSCALATTSALYVLWLLTQTAPPLYPALLWLAVFYLLFASLPFLWHGRHRRPVTIDRFSLALANLAWSLGSAGHLLTTSAPAALGVICGVLALLHTVLALAVRRRIPHDHLVFHGFLALGLLLLTLALFFLLPVSVLSVAWIAEACVLSWLAQRYEHRPTRVLALGLLGLGCGRILLWHLLPGHPGGTVCWNAWFLHGAMIPLGLAVWSLLQHAAVGWEARARQIVAALAWALVGPLVAIECAVAADWSLGLELTAAAACGLWALSALQWLRAQGLDAAMAVAWVLRLLALGLLLCAFPESVPGGALLNARFLITAALLAETLWTLPRRPETVALGLLAVFGMGGIEVWTWVADPLDRVRWLCLLAGLTGLWALRQGAVIVVRTALLPVFLGLLLSLLGGLMYDLHGPWPLLNEGFATLLAGSALLFALLRRAGLGARSGWLLAQLVLPLLLLTDIWAWQAQALASVDRLRWSCWWAVVIWQLPWGMGRWLTRRRQETCPWGPAVLSQLLALLPLVVLLVLPWPVTLPFFNLRAGAVCCLVAVPLLLAGREPCLRVLMRLQWGLGLVLASQEWWAWAAAGGEPRVAAFGITATWLVAAILALTHGFRRRQRGARLLGLGLLAASFGRLILVHLADHNEIWRIVAFLAAGLVFLAISWCYQRQEPPRSDPS